MSFRTDDAAKTATRRWNIGDRVRFVWNDQLCEGIVREHSRYSSTIEATIDGVSVGDLPVPYHKLCAVDASIDELEERAG